MITIQKIKTTRAVSGALSIGLMLLFTSSLIGQSTGQSKQAGAAAQPGGGGTQTVNAQQSGSWTIGLDPARNTVRLANSEADPLPVKVIPNGATGRKAYQKRVTFDLAVGFNQGGAAFALPAGKRFVIEHMSALVRLPQGIQPYLHMFTNMDDGDGILTPEDVGNQHFVLVQQMNSAGLTIWTANHKVVVYTDENIGGTQINHTVALQLSGNVSLPSKGEVTFSGYLEDLPGQQN